MPLAKNTGKSGVKTGGAVVITLFVLWLLEIIFPESPKLYNPAAATVIGGVIRFAMTLIKKT